MSGISDPFPNMFDPANLLGNAGSSNSGTSEVKRWRESELTHGRVAMLAALGFVVQEQIQDYPNTPFPHVEGESTFSTKSATRTHHLTGCESKLALSLIQLLIVYCCRPSHHTFPAG